MASRYCGNSQLIRLGPITIPTIATDVEKTIVNFFNFSLDCPPESLGNVYCITIFGTIVATIKNCNAR